MKSRLSSTVWTLVVVNGLALLVVIGLAFHAGREAGGDKSILDFASLPSGASGAVILAVLLSLVVGGFLAWRLGSSVVTPERQLAEFSQRLAGRDPLPRAGLQPDHEFRNHSVNLNRHASE